MTNLEKFGVKELNSKEIKETDGGIIPFLIYGAAVLVEVVCYAAAGDIILNFNSYSEALDSKISECSN